MADVKRSSPEPRNWFFSLLVPVGVVFVMTALAYAVIPTLEDRAAAEGQMPPASVLRAALREDGWWWLLIQAGVLVVLSIAAMISDARRNPT